MLGWFKSKIDLTPEEQVKELRDCYGSNPLAEQVLQTMLAGLDCDEVPDASGPFGSMKNPIPVNGARGELMYLKRLRCACGVSIMFHRLGSTKLGTDHGDAKALDIFEVVCLNAKHWGVFFLDLYHPRRSLKTPEGFTNAPWDKTFSPLPVAWGTTKKAENFPLDLPQCIAEQLGGGIGAAFGRKCRESIGDGSLFVPPSEHAERKKNYLAAIKGNAAMGIIQAVADMGEVKPDKPVFF